MNTVMITGTAKTVPFKTELCTSFKVEYNIIIWASKEGEQLQAITFGKHLLCGYGDLWHLAKKKAIDYLKEPKMGDGLYTQFLDHLITI